MIVFCLFVKDKGRRKIIKFENKFFSQRKKILEEKLKNVPRVKRRRSDGGGGKRKKMKKRSKKESVVTFQDGAKNPTASKWFFFVTKKS